MQKVTVEELIDYKILPFDIFTEDEKLLFSAGEVMTPGKFLKLRHVENIYKQENFSDLNNDVEEDNNFAEEASISEDEFLINKFSVFLKNEQIALQQADKEQTAKILSENLSKIENEKFASKLRLLGDYEVCHRINSAIFAVLLSNKLGKNKDFIEHIIQTALKTMEANEEEKMIVDICEYFDDLLFNKTEYTIKNVRDALKKMLEIGSKRFLPEVLYKFVYMFNYNDTKQLHEILI